MNVVFILTAHAADDDRVWFHQAKALLQFCNVKIVASRSNFVESDKFVIYSTENTSRNERISNIADILSNCSPDVAICDTPIAIKAALKYKKTAKKTIKVLYDVTEWYPSKKNLRNCSTFISKIAKFSALAFANFSSSKKVDGFIFGEYYKSKPYKFFFGGKPFAEISYYPDLKYISTLPARNISSEVKLFFAGDLTEEKGWFDVLEVSKALAQKNPELSVILNVITSSSGVKHNENLPRNLTLNFQKWLPFEDFCALAADNDIYLDLRSADAENSRCLPIKMFYYMAMGRPVIYSDLAAIRKCCSEFLSFAHLVDPFNHSKIVSIIENYIADFNEYQKHCIAARTLAEKKYNWRKIENQFVDFVLNYGNKS